MFLKRMKYFFIIIFFLIATYGFAQNEYNRLIEFAGIVVTADSLRPIPFVHIFVKDSRRGTVSDINGLFSIVGEKGQTIVFSAVGYKTVFFKIPDTLKHTFYNLIQPMITDTIYLDKTVVYPWPSKEKFKEAFINTVPPDDDLERARKNLAFMEWKDKEFNYVARDGQSAYNQMIKEISYKNYYAGQLPPNNLLNPFAWAAFVKAWQEGQFKRNSQPNKSQEYYYNEPLH
jgi:hypothetical protein